MVQQFIPWWRMTGNAKAYLPVLLVYNYSQQESYKTVDGNNPKTDDWTSGFMFSVQAPVV